MKLTLILASSLLLAFVTNNPTEKVVQDNTEFAFKLYGSLDKKDKNVFLSPYSISSALAMTYSGARTTTADEMAKVMHFSGNSTAFHGSFHELLTQLNSRNNSDVEMRIANRLFGERSFKFRDSFLLGTKNWYNAPLEQLDFRNNPGGSEQKINHWVEDQTKNRIKDLIPPGTLNSLTRLVLVNAIYFYGDWANQFDSAFTRQEDFFAGGTKKKPTKLMHQKGQFEYMENNQFQAIRLPYKGNTLSMEIFLPKKNDGLDRLEKSLSGQQYASWKKEFKTESVVLTLPKFTMTTDFSLGQNLQQMGMKGAFTDEADFSGMTGKKDLKIDKVIHKAFVDVSEKGTEAAAATAVIMVEITSLGPRGPEPKIFRADHPFFFLIRDNQTGSILFMGRLDDPE